MKIKNIIVFLLTIIMIASIAGCSTHCVTDNGNESVDKNGNESIDKNGNDENHDITESRTFLYSSSGELSDFLSYSDNEIRPEHKGFSAAEENGFYYYYEYFPMDDIENTSMANPVNPSENLEYRGTRCSKKSPINDEYGRKYCMWDDYSDDDDRTSIMVYHNTDVVIFYSCSDESVEKQGKDLLTENEAKIMSDNILKEFLPEDEFNVYEYYGFSFSKSENLPAQAIKYAVTYVHKVNGYITDDYIQVFITGNDVIVGFGAPGRQKYEDLERSDMSEKINEAKDCLIDKLKELNFSDLDYKEPIIRRNLAGDLFLCIDFSYTVVVENEKITLNETAYVSIE